VFDSSGLAGERRELSEERDGSDNELGTRRADEFGQRARLTGDASGAGYPRGLMKSHVVPFASVDAKERTIQRKRCHRQGKDECEDSSHLDQYMPHKWHEVSASHKSPVRGRHPMEGRSALERQDPAKPLETNRAL
jgi:hypothetical protein